MTAKHESKIDSYFLEGSLGTCITKNLRNCIHMLSESYKKKKKDNPPKKVHLFTRTVTEAFFSIPFSL